MGHDTLNKKMSVPDVPRKPHVSGAPDAPDANMLYNDHLIDPLTDDTLREEWLRDETDSNPLISAEKDIEESRYGAELGKRAFDLNGTEADDDTHDEEEINKDDKDDG